MKPIRLFAFCCSLVSLFVVLGCCGGAKKKKFGMTTIAVGMPYEDVRKTLLLAGASETSLQMVGGYEKYRNYTFSIPNMDYVNFTVDTNTTKIAFIAALERNVSNNGKSLGKWVETTSIELDRKPLR